MTAENRSNDGRFGFGRNWNKYSRLIDAERIATAEQSIRDLLRADRLDALTFLDIGCGSGLFSLAALNLGAASVTAIDIDPESVETTCNILRRHAKTDKWKCQTRSVFGLNPQEFGVFDIVYSWGVLHHTGDLGGAVQVAAEMVKPGGLLALALYKKTPFCRYWKVEKRLYSASPALVQYLIRALYKAVLLARKLSLGENPLAHVRNYHEIRGMNWTHDVHDWLGGYPYESVSPDDVKDIAATIGFEIVHSNIQTGGSGLLGTGCDEYVLSRIRQAPGTPSSGRSREALESRAGGKHEPH